jgi:hypothetical protein
MRELITRSISGIVYVSLVVLSALFSRDVFICVYLPIGVNANDQVKAMVHISYTTYRLLFLSMEKRLDGVSLPTTHCHIIGEYIPYKRFSSRG